MTAEPKLPRWPGSEIVTGVAVIGVCIGVWWSLGNYAKPDLKIITLMLAVLVAVGVSALGSMIYRAGYERGRIGRHPSMTTWRHGAHTYTVVSGLARCDDEHVVSDYHVRDDGRRTCPVCYGRVTVLDLDDYYAIVNGRPAGTKAGDTP